jgi:magnesium transporter
MQEPVLDHVQRDYLHLRADETIRDAIHYFHSNNFEHNVSYIYVLDTDRRLVGVVPTRKLLLNAPSTRIGDIMLQDIVAVPSTASVYTACELFYRHRYLSLPVINMEGRLEGILDVNQFTTAVADQSKKNSRRTYDDIFQIIGVHLAAAKKKSPFLAFKNRMPWLLCNMLGGLFCAVVLGRYEGLFDMVIVLAFFVPMVLTLAESVGMQSMTITLQRLHKDLVNWKYFIVAVRNEFVTSTLLGASCGTIIAALVWLWKGYFAMALAIGYSVMLTIITSCILGVVIPMLVRRFSKDPKLAAGPVILAAADIITLLVYMNIAAQMLKNHGAL